MSKSKRSSRRGSKVQWPDRLHWWIDAVGGFLVLRSHTISIGQAGNSEMDIGIMGDLSKKHATINRGESGFLIEAVSSTKVNDQEIQTHLLKHGDIIELRSVKLKFHQPPPWTGTCRLEMVSHQRFPMAMDGVILLGEVCLIGSREDCHIYAPWEHNIFLSWVKNQYWVRCSGQDLRINGELHHEVGPLEPNVEIETGFGAFRWEKADASN